MRVRLARTDGVARSASTGSVVGAAEGGLALVTDEQALVARVRAGDAGAFRILFDRHVTGLLNFAHAETGSREVAEDIVQEMWLGVWSRRGDWVVTHSVATYLFQAVRHRVSNYRRDRRRFVPATGSAVQSVPPERPSGERTDDGCGVGDLQAALDRAIGRLPERCREVFTLSRYHGMSTAEIAVALGISAKTVEVHMTRALTALRASLADWTRS